MGWFRLGEFHEAAGALDQAARSLAHGAETGAGGSPGAALKLQLIGAAPPAKHRLAPSSKRCSTSMPTSSTTRWSIRSAIACPNC